MSEAHLPIFERTKVESHPERVTDYLAGRPIFTTTMEMDLSMACTRACEGCPFGSVRGPRHSLSLPFLDRLFGILGGQAPGLVLSGGEPTLART